MEITQNTNIELEHEGDMKNRKKHVDEEEGDDEDES